MKKIYITPDVFDIKINGGVLCASGELEPFNDWNDGTIADDRWHDLGSF